MMRLRVKPAMTWRGDERNVGMKPYIILIAGMPASGKTTYGRHLAERLCVPFVGKDDIKSVLHDELQFDTSKWENFQIFGKVSYGVLTFFVECLMKGKVSFVAESNYHPIYAETLSPMLTKYGYRALTVLLDGDTRALHKRFWQRNSTAERHPGLGQANNFYDDFNYFKANTELSRDFSVGDKIIMDTTDFAKVNYGEVDKKVIKFIGGAL